VSTDKRIAEPSAGLPAADHTRIPCYEIRVRGHLGTRWTTWFDGMTLTNQNDGTTVISGPVVDQAALHGLIQKLRDLSVCLLSLTRIGPDTATGHPPSIYDQSRPNPPGAPS